MGVVISVVREIMRLSRSLGGTIEGSPIEEVTLNPEASSTLRADQNRSAAPQDEAAAKVVFNLGQTPKDFERLARLYRLCIGRSEHSGR